MSENKEIERTEKGKKHDQETHYLPTIDTNLVDTKTKPHQLIGNTSGENITTGYQSFLESQNKLVAARSNLISSIKDRGLKEPLKWSKWVSEVNIPDYREECRHLGDPLLFTYHHRLPTPLYKKEEKEDLTDSNSPLATFSYYLKNDNRKLNKKRKENSIILGLEREVSISELHDLMLSQTSAGGGTTGHNLNVQNGLNISIENMNSIAFKKTALNSLPKIKLILKPGSQCYGDRLLKKSLFAQTKFKSHSWDSMRSQDKTRHLTKPKYEIKENNKQYSFESFEELQNRNPQSKEPKRKQEDITIQNRENKKTINLRKLKQCSRSDITRDWIHASPLGPAQLEFGTEHFTQIPTRKRSARKVRFGSDSWIYKDSKYMFD